MNVIYAVCCGGLLKKKRLISAFSDAVNNTWRVETRCLDIQAAALDHFLCCSPPIKPLSVRVNVSNDRENGCPPRAHSTFFSLVSPRSASQLPQPTNNCINVSAEESAAGNFPAGFKTALFPYSIMWIVFLCVGIKKTKTKKPPDKPRRSWLCLATINKSWCE